MPQNYANSTPTAEELIDAEVARQDRMWGSTNERADVSNGELMEAAMAQLDALFDRLSGDPTAFDSPPFVYPENWAGFRDYGSNIANLVVAAAFLRQEIRRRLRDGEDFTRTSRDPMQQPYGKDQPAVYLP